MNITEELTIEQMQVLKHWLFKENARLENERLTFEADKRDFIREKEAHYSMHDIMKNQLVREKQIFDQKWKVLERELRNLAFDKDKFEKTKRENVLKGNFKGAEIFFAGIKTDKDLKKRYKELIKIFHPDNEVGDSAIMIEINEEYEKLKFNFQI